MACRAHAAGHARRSPRNTSALPRAASTNLVVRGQKEIRTTESQRTQRRQGRKKANDERRTENREPRTKGRGNSSLLVLGSRFSVLGSSFAFLSSLCPL